jgi:hypothetical protein
VIYSGLSVDWAQALGKVCRAQSQDLYFLVQKRLPGGPDHACQVESSLLTSIDPPACISVILQQKSCVEKSRIRFHVQGRFMKEVAILLLIALMLNGCGNSGPTAAQTAAGLNWQAQMLGVDGLSFITQFTINSDGTLNISNFQFDTHDSASCFPDNGGTETGSMALTVNSTTFAVTGTFTFTIVSGANTLTLSGNVTGTESGTTLTGGSITGSWSLAGSGTPAGCTNANGTFTMTQS